MPKTIGGQDCNRERNGTAASHIWGTSALRTTFMEAL